MRRLVPSILVLILPLLACSIGKPPVELFHDNIDKMVLLDRAMGFQEEISNVRIVKMTAYDDEVEVEVRVEGWAVHKDVAMGATLPASRERKQGWATWKFFTHKEGKRWVIREKFKVAEGFSESGT